MNSREKYINFIMKYAADEIKTVSDALNLAKMSTGDLYREVIDITEYYERVHNKII